MKRLILTGVGSALILAACNSQPAYLGRWERHVISVSHPEGTTEVLELSPDGKLVLSPPPFPDMSETGRFEVIDRQRLRVELYGVTGICTAQVHRAELRFTDPSGRTTVYDRAE